MKKEKLTKQEVKLLCNLLDRLRIECSGHYDSTGCDCCLCLLNLLDALADGVVNTSDAIKQVKRSSIWDWD